MKHLKNFVNSYLKIPESDWQIIEKSFSKKNVPRNHLLLQEGKVCNNLSFLEKGLLRFFVLKDGVEITKFFTIAPYFFTSQTSFNLRTPATESIETIEESTIWETSFELNEQLLKLSSWNSFARKITQEVQFFTENILEELQSETAESRYKKLMMNDPELLNRIPSKYLASFYGIAPQSLSRIKKKLHNEFKS